MSNVPWGGLAAAVVILIGEAVFVATTEPLTGVPYLQPTSDDAMLAAKHALLPRAAGRVLLLGDSSCFFGLQPSVVAAECGEPVVNLGAMAFFSTAGCAAMVEEAMSRDEPPLAVVLALYPETLGRTARDTREVGVLGRYLAAYGQTSPYYQPTLYERWSLLARKHRFNIMPPEFEGSYARFSETIAADDGYYAEAHVYKGSPTKDATFRVDNYSFQPIVSMASRLQAAGIPFVFWMSPTPSDAFTDSYVESQRKFLETLTKDAPGTTVVQSEPPVMAVEWFATRTHVTPDGAARNSVRLGAALAPILRKSAATTHAE